MKKNDLIRVSLHIFSNLEQANEKIQSFPHQQFEVLQIESINKWSIDGAIDLLKIKVGMKLIVLIYAYEWSF